MVRSCVPLLINFILLTDLDVDKIRLMMSRDGYLKKLAKRVLSHVPSTRDGAIMALLDLCENQGAGRHIVITSLVRNSSPHSVEDDCDGSHRGSENDTGPRRAAQAEIDCSFCCLGAGASREDW